MLCRHIHSCPQVFTQVVCLSLSSSRTYVHSGVFTSQRNAVWWQFTLQTTLTTKPASESRQVHTFFRTVRACLFVATFHNSIPHCTPEHIECVELNIIQNFFHTVLICKVKIFARQNITKPKNFDVEVDAFPLWCEWAFSAVEQIAHRDGKFAF